jgi:acetyl-CoA carboxylase biotin carboxyl carrier protein
MADEERTDAPTAAGDLRPTLARATERALSLLDRLPGSPSSLRVHVGGVDVDWPEPTAPAALSGPVTDGSVMAAEARTDPADAAPTWLRAPTVGIFTFARRPSGEPLVAVGDEIVAGQQLAVVRLLGLDVPVTADVGGTVVEVLRKDGDPVEHDEPLFALTTG